MSVLMLLLLPSDQSDYSTPTTHPTHLERTSHGRLPTMISKNQIFLQAPIHFSVVRHELGDLPFLPTSPTTIRHPKPKADNSKAYHQAKEAAAKADPNNGDYGKTPVPSWGKWVAIHTLVALEAASVEPREAAGAVGEQRRHRPGESVVGDVERREARQQAELLRDGAGEEVVVEVDDVEVCAGGQLQRDAAGELVAGEVEDSEVEQPLEVRGDFAAELVGGEVEGLEVGAVGEGGGDGAGEGEGGEG